jgi:hypothetical protein
MTTTMMFMQWQEILWVNTYTILWEGTYTNKIVAEMVLRLSSTQWKHLFRCMHPSIF